jgi:hypothetical protein
MAIKYEKLQPGMTLFDVHSYRMGNTTMRELGSWTVKIIELHPEIRAATVSWNGNAPRKWHHAELKRLYLKEPPRYLKQQERKAERQRLEHERWKAGR